ncbi:MAG TPA: cytochrome c maturation protein CcmE [Acidimicrobiales bacterium]|nr:cytochrome c maturation protein CcmE [Acidimicrobiales bacterium]
MTTAVPAPPSSTGGSDPSRSPRARSHAPTDAPKSHRLRYVAVGLVLVGSFAFLLAKGLGSALDFYLPADQAVAQQASLGSKTFNLEGVVEPGSIHSTPNGVDFVVTSGSTRLQVDNTGSPPQLFAAGIPVIAVGHFGGSTFLSDQILVKHSSTYIAQHPGRVTAPNGTKR